MDESNAKARHSNELTAMLETELKESKDIGTKLRVALHYVVLGNNERAHEIISQVRARPRAEYEKSLFAAHDLAFLAKAHLDGLWPPDPKNPFGHFY